MRFPQPWAAIDKGAQRVRLREWRPESEVVTVEGAMGLLWRIGVGENVFCLMD
jgi:hypothetical protein